jgi:hypothetical protein
MQKREQTLLWVLGGAVVLYLLARSDTGSALVTDILTSGSRGIRNNNPGSIRKSQTTWAGQTPTQSDPAFVQFIAPEYGIRAMAKVLKSYFSRGTDTIEKVISTWAPATENNTTAYIASVAKNSNLAANAKLSAADLGKIIPAIIQHENGAQPYSLDIINKGISLS